MSKQRDDDRPQVSVQLKAVFHLPKRRTRRRRELVRRLAAAAATLTAAAERPGAIEGDDCNLADLVESLEAMASTVRRMAASAHNADGD